MTFKAVEICAGAGGQAIGLHRAGFDHVLAIELDTNAAATLRNNTGWNVVVGDVADEVVCLMAPQRLSPGVPQLHCGKSLRKRGMSCRNGAEPSDRSCH